MREVRKKRTSSCLVHFKRFEILILVYFHVIFFFFGENIRVLTQQKRAFSSNQAGTRESSKFGICFAAANAAKIDHNGHVLQGTRRGRVDQAPSRSKLTSVGARDAGSVATSL